MADGRHEGRHRPGRELLWGESWYFDFAVADAQIGGFVRLGLYPNLGVAWYWAYVVGTGRQLVAVRDHDVALPRGPTLEVRAEGLWSAINCETPNEHWSIGLEAFASGMDDPGEAYRGERGDRVALGFDLEWEAASPAFDLPGTTRYQQCCAVHGEVLVGRERLSVDAFGQRGHGWGVQDWWGHRSWWTAGRLADGTAFQALLAPSLEWGYLIPPAGDPMPLAPIAVDTTLGPDGLPESADLALGRLALVVKPLAHGPVALEGPDGRSSRLVRSLCRFDSADGRPGVGWSEWLQPSGGD